MHVITAKESLYKDSVASFSKCFLTVTANLSLSFAAKARATLETGCPHTVLSQEHGQGATRQDCFVLIPAHTGVMIVYCGTVVPAFKCQLDDSVSQVETRVSIA